MRTTRLTLTMLTAGVLAGSAAAQHAPARIADQAPGNITKAETPQEAKPAPKTTKKKAEAEAPGLTIGDPAPAPTLAHIFKGDTDFDGFDSDNVYVMEFWATWCGPCRAGMPHLTEVQEKYKDQGVTLIGVSREKMDTVKNFLDKPEWDKKTGYTLALDSEDKTNAAYMKAANQNGIPTAFIVGKTGQVEWIGHPMRMDEPLAQVVAGNWDRDAFKTGYMKAEASKLRAQKIRRELMTAQRAGDWAKAVKVLDKALEEEPDNLNYQVQKFEMMVGPMNDGAGYELGWTLLKNNRDNSGLLNAIAWYTLDDEAVQDRDLEFALAAAKASNEAAAGTNPAVLDTLARAYYEMDDMDRAIKFQRKAVEKCGEDDGPMCAELKDTLKKYEDAAKSKAA
ncbi:MAG: redoxin domain-containing protein [Phycisphaerales bacterium]|nr:redoxin domain-containing protein [Phycisphaerales bacterium]